MNAVRVRHEPPSAAVVRHRIEQDLIDAHVSSDTADIVLLVASELVGNAVRHCTPSSPDSSIGVSWDVDRDSVTVRVTDSSTVMPYLREPRATDPYGRGLAIVEAVSEDWGADVGHDGKQVWARIPVQRAADLHAV